MHPKSKETYHTENTESRDVMIWPWEHFFNKNLFVFYRFYSFLFFLVFISLLFDSLDNDEGTWQPLLSSWMIVPIRDLGNKFSHNSANTTSDSKMNLTSSEEMEIDDFHGSGIDNYNNIRG